MKAREFSAIVTITHKEYSRSRHIWDLRLCVRSASGLPADVKEIEATRKQACKLRTDCRYKVWGNRWPDGCCTIEHISELKNLIAIKKLVLAEKHAKKED